MGKDIVPYYAVPGELIDNNQKSSEESQKNQLL